MWAGPGVVIDRRTAEYARQTYGFQFHPDIDTVTDMLRFGFAILLAIYSATTTCADENWVGFRGRGDSISAAKNLPVTWEQRGRTGWTTRLSGYGQSSPVVWKKQVFATSVSGDDKEHLHVASIDFDTGEKIWQKDFAATQKVKDSDTVSRGAPTPVVDSERLYASFESGDVVALSHAGNVLWQSSFVKDYGEIKGPHGYASSPVLVDGLLIIQVCHPGHSYLLAIDSKTGSKKWKADHPSQTGWSSPAIYSHEQTTAIVLSTAGSVRAYDAKDGTELWYVTGLSGNSTASPTIAGDLVVIGAGERGGGGGPRRGSTEGRPPPQSDRTHVDRVRSNSTPGVPAPAESAAPTGSIAIRLGGRGDVTQTHVVWKTPKATTGYSSPLVYQGFVYLTNKVGVVQCVDLQSGEIKWQQRLPGQMWASAVAHDAHLYFFCNEGAVVVLKAGPELQRIADNSISVTDVVYGVAAVDNAWIVRSGRSLVKISGTADR